MFLNQSDSISVFHAKEHGKRNFVGRNMVSSIDSCYKIINQTVDLFAECLPLCWLELSGRLHNLLSGDYLQVMKQEIPSLLVESFSL